VVIEEQRHRFNNLHSVMVMTKWQVRDVMARLSAGDTVRTIVGANIVSLNKFNTHMKAWPLWGASIITSIVANRKVAYQQRAKWRADRTHCKQGHEYTPENTTWQKDGSGRQCKTCNLIAANKGKVLSAEEVATIKAKLTAGIPLGWIAGSKSPNRSHYVANFAAINRLRREDAGFAQFVENAIAGNNARGQLRRHHRKQIRRRRQEADDYQAIRAQVPKNWHAHDDIVQSIYRALLEGIIKREDVAQHVNRIRIAEEQLLPSHFARRTEMRLDQPVQRGGENLVDVLIFDPETGFVNFSSTFGQ
jgi:hypothetical protein